MKNTKNKIKIITIMAFLVAILSIGVGYSSYNTTNEISGKATIIENLCDIKIDNIKDVNTSLETITFKDTPSIISNTIIISIIIKNIILIYYFFFLFIFIRYS